MRLQKSAPKLYYNFILPSDEGINWAETAREIFRSDKMLQDNFRNNLEVDGVKADEKTLEELFVKAYKKSSILRHLVSQDFDTDIIKGEPIKLVIEGITPNDLELLQDSMKMVNSTTGDEQSLKAMKEVVQVVLKNKLHSVEYPSSVSKEDQLNRDEAIDMFVKEAQFEDLNLFALFLKSMVEGFITKKKTLRPSAE